MNRIERRSINRIKKMRFNQLDRIYKTCKEIADMWDLNTVQLTTLKMTISKSKPSIDTSNKAVNDMNKGFIQTLDALYFDMNKVAKNMAVKKVPVSEILRWINEWKRVYISAMPK